MKPDFQTRRTVFGFCLLLLCLLMLVQCGGGKGGSDNPSVPGPTPTPTASPNPSGSPTPSPGPQQGQAHTKLYFFSAPWCHECKTKLIALRDRWNAELGNKKWQIETTVQVVSGASSTTPATQEVADQYKMAMGLTDFKAVADKNYKTYHMYFEEGSMIPAAVILSADDKLLKPYEPGSVDVDDLFIVLKSKLQ